METTLILLKPDCVQRNLMGEVIGRFEKKGLDGNIMHASDSVENANEELARFFKPEEIFDYERLDNKVL